jgi:chromosome partitioning protein
MHNAGFASAWDPDMRRVVFNQKGGVGKSTITCNLAAIAAHQGQRTLVADLDRQGTLVNVGSEATDHVC